MKPSERGAARAPMAPGEILDAVCDKYSRVATHPHERFSFPVGREFAESVGYPKELLERLPASMTESFAGAHNPLLFADLEPGETVLDLGCGAGLDMYIAATAVGPGGFVHGLDMSDRMLKKAKRNLSEAGIGNAAFHLGVADEIPLPDVSVDIVVSNGIYNLSPDKAAVLREVHRVVRPGGRTIFSEIVMRAAREEGAAAKLRDWFQCIGGALPIEDFLRLMADIGFEQPTVLDLRRNARTGHELAVCATIRALKPAAS